MIKNTVTRGKTNVYQEKKIIVNEGSQTFKIDTPTISVKEQDAVIHNYDLCINKTPMNSSTVKILKILSIPIKSIRNQSKSITQNDTKKP
jgi:hypothetical protein